MLVDNDIHFSQHFFFLFILTFINNSEHSLCYYNVMKLIYTRKIEDEFF